VPTVRLDDFRDGLDAFAYMYPEISAEFAALDSGTTILHGAEVVTGRPLWLMLHTEDVPADEALLGVCAVPSSSEIARKYGFMYAKSATVFVPRSG
jgi:hypothetical protein